MKKITQLITRIDNLTKNTERAVADVEELSECYGSDLVYERIAEILDEYNC